MTATEPISEFFDREACCRAGARAGVGAGTGEPARVTGVSRTLLEALEAVGIRGLTVLEPGSGLGGLSLALLFRGASRATGIDLSPASVEATREKAREAGFADRASFSVGDASAAELEPHDVVVLDKVFCCYPDAEALLEPSLRAAGSVYAFVLPESRGLRGVASRVGVAAENLWRRVRGRAFRAYVHDVRRIDRAVREAGFRVGRRTHRLVWLVAVYERAA